MQVPMECATSEQLRAWALSVTALAGGVGAQASALQGLGGSVGSKGRATTFSSPLATKITAQVGSVESSVRGAAGRLSALARQLSTLATELQQRANIVLAQEIEVERAAAERRADVREAAQAKDARRNLTGP